MCVERLNAITAKRMREQKALLTVAVLIQGNLSHADAPIQSRPMLPMLCHQATDLRAEN